MKNSISNGESPREQVDRLKTQNSELRRTLQLSEEVRAVLADQYDFAPVGFVTLDAKGCVREINLTAVRLLACERAPLLGMPFVVHFAQEHVRTFLNHIRDCQTGSREVVCEAALRVRGGGMIPCEFRSVLVLDPRHGDKVVRTTIIDISERRRTLRALQESDERYRELVELSPDGIFIVSKGVIVFANSAAAGICGVEGREQLVGREFVTLSRPAFSAAVGAIVAGGSSGDKATPVEIKFARGNGRSIDVEVVPRPFRHEGERAVLIVARDISRRKNAERDVLKISDRERASFGRDLHDSICQSLMGTTLLAEGLAKQLRKVHPRSAALADQLARALRSCGEEARNLARGLCPITMQQHGLVAALHELASEVETRARVKCTLQCDERIMVEDTARAAHLYRIAQEAIANAIRHGDAKSVFISLGGNNGQITLRVEDNGKGLPAKPKQSGMGLHTMRYRASLIGGSIDVRRARRHGTVVTCTFSSHAA